MTERLGVARPNVGSPAWFVAFLAGGAVAIRTFGNGLLLNWDQVIGPTIPIPPGFSGLGPELPRRVPFYGPLAVVSDFIGGPNTVAVLVWLIVSVACLGVVRLVGTERADRGSVAIALGVVYALSPFLLSRLAIGHLPLAAATALLPHALCDLADRRRRWLWAVVFGFTGSSGAVLGMVPLTIATLRRERAGERLRSVVVLAASQAPWVVPGLIVLLGDGVLPEAASSLFRARMDGLFGPARAVAGGGLFLVEEDVAARSPAFASVLGLLLLVGVVGLVRSRRSTDLPDPLDESRSDLVWSALVGVALFVAPTLPWLAALWSDALVGPLVILRETHKFWPLFALPLIAGLGSLLGARAGRSERVPGAAAVAFGLATLAVVVAWPGLWGAGGRLTPHAESPALAAIRSELASGEHVVLALPWQRYGPTSLADGRTALEPAPWLVEGTVLASGNAFTSVSSEERATPNDEAFARIDQQVRSGSAVADELRTLGVDRVVVMGSPDAELYRRLGSEEGVETLVADPPGTSGGALLLFAIDGRPIKQRSSSNTWLLVVVAQLAALGAAIRFHQPVTVSS